MLTDVYDKQCSYKWPRTILHSLPSLLVECELCVFKAVGLPEVELCFPRTVIQTGKLRQMQSLIKEPRACPTGIFLQPLPLKHTGLGHLYSTGHNVLKLKA